MIHMPLSNAQPAPLRILMVCMGNICRSPTAEGVLRAKMAQAGLAKLVQIDSAGTHNYHPGSPPDERSQQHALARGYDLSKLRARQVQEVDFERFDMIFAMDWDNLALLQADSPPAHQSKLQLFMQHADQSLKLGEVVPDPYYGGSAGFEQVLSLLEAASDGLVRKLRYRLENYRLSDL
jgi:protein-tyrosine phosphatase